MKLEKRYLEVVYKTIVGTEGELTLSEGRIRDNFLKPLTEATTTFENDRKKIYEKFCDKNKKGEPDLTNNQYHFKKEVVGELTKELEVLLAEEVDLPVNTQIKAIIEKTTYKPKIGEAELIDTFINKL